MDEQEGQQKQKKQQPQINLEDISIETQNYYSSLGKMVQSNKPTAAKYGFGSSTRKAQQKVYQSKQLVKSQFIGKTSVGIKEEYKYTEAKDKFSYKTAPSWKNVMGKQPRNTLDIKQKYDFYDFDEDDCEPLDADAKRRWQQGRVKFGRSKRFNSLPKPEKSAPGPKYDPPHRQNFNIPPKYSFGVRREIPGYSPIIPLISTKPAVGPGKYFRTKKEGKLTKPLKIPKDSRHKEAPAHKVPQDLRFKDAGNVAEVNQTYETYRSCGVQQRSKKTTEPTIKFTKANRDVKTGMFKDMMATRPTRVQIPHPKF